MKDFFAALFLIIAVVAAIIFAVNFQMKKLMAVMRVMFIPNQYLVRRNLNK